MPPRWQHYPMPNNWRVGHSASLEVYNGCKLGFFKEDPNEVTPTPFDELNAMDMVG
jgi:hypothetical protein